MHSFLSFESPRCSDNPLTSSFPLFHGYGQYLKPPKATLTLHHWKRSLSISIAFLSHIKFEEVGYVLNSFMY